MRWLGAAFATLLIGAEPSQATVSTTALLAPPTHLPRSRDLLLPIAPGVLGPGRLQQLPDRPPGCRLFCWGQQRGGALHSCQDGQGLSGPGLQRVQRPGGHRMWLYTKQILAFDCCNVRVVDYIHRVSQQGCHNFRRAGDQRAMWLNQGRACCSCVAAARADLCGGCVAQRLAGFLQVCKVPPSPCRISVTPLAPRVLFDSALAMGFHGVCTCTQLVALVHMRLLLPGCCQGRGVLGQRRAG